MKSNELLNTEIDAFIASAAKLSDEDIIKRTDEYEHQIYRNIDKTLDTFDEIGSKAINKIYEEVTALNNRLSALHDLHRKNPLLYFHAFNMTVIPENNKSEPALYLREQYHHFMDHTLAFRKEGINKEDVAVCIRKLMSQPIGQRLIVKLNQLNEQYGCCVTVTAQAQGSLAVRPIEGSMRSETAATMNKDEQLSSPLKLFDYPKKAWNKIELFYPPQFWKDPQYFFKALDFGKNKCMVFKPAFISIGHELTHALHFFRGKDRCKMPFPVAADKHTEMLFGKNTEELWTIDLGNISENKLRQEHGMQQRYSHIRAFQFAEGPYSLEGIHETLAEIRSESKERAREAETTEPTPANDLVILPLNNDKPSCCIIS